MYNLILLLQTHFPDCQLSTDVEEYSSTGIQVVPSIPSNLTSLGLGRGCQPVSCHKIFTAPSAYLTKFIKLLKGKRKNDKKCLDFT